MAIDAIRQYTSMLCISAVGCCALKMLLPENALEGVLKTVLSVFFLLCLLVPLRGLTVDLTDRDALSSAADPGTQRLAKTYEEHLSEAVAENMRRVVEAKLLKLGIPQAEINIQTNVNITEEERIDISGIEVFLNEGHAALAPQIRAYIEGDLELSCTIHTSVASVKYDDAGEADQAGEVREEENDGG